MLRVVNILALLLLCSYSFGCATHRSAVTSYASVLATNDPTSHPRIVQLRHYTGTFDSPEWTPGTPLTSGYLFDVLAPPRQRGSTLWLHYCDPPGGHVSLARSNAVYLLTFTRDADFGTNEPSCIFAYRLVEVR
jgi:hypothetical protein